jgi:hypothetical protein
MATNESTQNLDGYRVVGPYAGGIDAETSRVRERDWGASSTGTTEYWGGRLFANYGRAGCPFCPERRADCDGYSDPQVLTCSTGNSCEEVLPPSDRVIPVVAGCRESARLAKPLCLVFQDFDHGPTQGLPVS